MRQVLRKLRMIFLRNQHAYSNWHQYMYHTSYKQLMLVVEAEINLLYILKFKNVY
jgi:hypothetical protein